MGGEGLETRLQRGRPCLGLGSSGGRLVRSNIGFDGPVYPPGVPERVQALVKAGDPEGALELFFREVVRMPDRELEMYRTLPAWKARITLAPTIPRELRIERTYRFQAERFAQFSIPTLLLLGGDSPPMFRRAIDRVAAAVPTSRIAVMPGQQHVAMDTAPELFLRELIGFLTDQVAARAAYGQSGP